ncbi:MAG: protein kinase [Planctomycetes bacterium]|nr:protein kinase [Planctomycetota bacterium]
MMDEIGENQLVARAQAGDRAAFDELARRLEARLKSFIRSQIKPTYRGRLDVDEVLQETLIRAFQSLPGFRGKDEDDAEQRFEDLAAHYADRLLAGDQLQAEKILSAHPTLGHEILEHLEAFIKCSSGGREPATLGTLGDYTLRRQIGRGGMGVVYEAWQNSMNRRVALKVMPKAVAADTRAVERFLREAQIAGKLAHPNIVTIHAIGIEERVPWYAMEFVEGNTLAQVIKKRGDALPEPAEIIRLAESFAAVADGLHHAHSYKIIHRDIKPSNLILDGEGRLRILDFGLARLEGQESLTASGDFLGTPLYMSPEQARRKKIPIDHRTDIYSLGVTLYEMLAGRPPFQGKDHQDTLSQIIERDPVEPRKANPRVPISPSRRKICSRYSSLPDR